MSKLVERPEIKWDELTFVPPRNPIVDPAPIEILRLLKDPEMLALYKANLTYQRALADSLVRYLAAIDEIMSKVG